MTAKGDGGARHYSEADRHYDEISDEGGHRHYEAHHEHYDNHYQTHSHESYIGSVSDDGSVEGSGSVDGSCDQVCRCCGAELRGANSMSSLQNSVLYDYFPATRLPSEWNEVGLELVGPAELPQYGQFFQRKLEERLQQVSTHINVEKIRKEENEKRLEHALKENEVLREHLKKLQTRVHSFHEQLRQGNGTAV